MDSVTIKAEALSLRPHAPRGRSCNVLVVYEDTQTRDKIMSACNLLVEKLWINREFSFTWWKFAHLHDPQTSCLAAAAAHEAELLIFSTEAIGEIPQQVQNWIEEWLPTRKKGGAIAALFGRSNVSLTLPTKKHQYLMDVARRGGLDYLSQILPNQPQSIEASLELILQRPDQLASIVKEILDHDPCMRRWGIND